MTPRERTTRAWLWWGLSLLAGGVAIGAIVLLPGADPSALDLWWDGVSPLPAFVRQYRGSIVNLSPGTSYEVAYSLDAGATWSASQQIRTRSEQFSGTAVRYSGIRKTKLVISQGGTPSSWRIIDGRNIAAIDVDHKDDCVQIKAPYVVLRNFTIRDCRFNAVVVEQASGLQDMDTRQLINVDHSNVCKPTSATDLPFSVLKTYMEQRLKDRDQVQSSQLLEGATVAGLL